MTDLDALREEYLAADAEASRLSGEYQAQVDEAARKWQEAKERYRDQIAEANERARQAQQAFCDAEAAQALLDRPDAESVLGSPGMQGDGADRLRRAYEAAKAE